MAARAFWKGYLKLSLVTCPVALIAGDQRKREDSLSHPQPQDGQPRRQPVRRRAERKPVEEDDEAKGYARGEDDYLVLEDEELESVRARERPHASTSKASTPADSIDWIWYDTPFYLIPDDPVGEEAYCVIRDAMRSTGMIGVSPARPQPPRARGRS